ncbi:hypothetical protein G9A89_022061 [Geosiphon pyriformis]|nr:hypothetical protein G9A89_022061 [Geosiphon pyriformis]
MAFLECFMKILSDQVSEILRKLSFVELVPIFFSSCVIPLVVVFPIGSNLNLDMAVNSVVVLLSSPPFPLMVENAISELSLSSSKVFTIKMSSLELKMMALEVSVGSGLTRLDSLYYGLGMNNSTKQDDIVCWHKEINNLISIVTETKLRDKVHLWIINRFDGVYVFTSGVNSGYLGFGVAIIMNTSLAYHVYKVSEVPGRILCVRLLFKNKLSVSILGLYAGASLVAVNEFSFVILGGDFNEDGFHKCISFKKYFDLGLVNSLAGSAFAKIPTWCNSHGIAKMIDYVFVFSNLVNVMVGHNVAGVVDYFDTDHVAVSVSVGLGGLLDVQLSLLHKQANKDCWKYDIKAVNADVFLSMFKVAERSLDLDAITFKKKWFKDYNSVFTKVSSKFHKLELLVFRLVKASHLVSSDDFVSLLGTWDGLDPGGAAEVKSLFLSDFTFDAVCSGLVRVWKFYHSFKFLEFKCAEKSCIRQVIANKMESFELDKGYTIRSVLKCPFCKVVLDHLIVDNELVLEPNLVKSKVDKIIKSWTRKCRVVLDISDDWICQYQPLDYVFDGAFSGVICPIGFDKLFVVISDLSDGKAVGLSGISNELWKHCDSSVLAMLSVLLNLCLTHESVLGSWRKA